MSAEKVVYVQHRPAPGIACALEMVCGLLQLFGVGHAYSGNVVLGVCIMVSYWLVLACNVLLCFVLVGMVTLPFCWACAMVASVLVLHYRTRRAACDELEEVRVPLPHRR